MAGDAAFAAIPDILDFEPVPRRSHVNNWTAEHQRAFIAALALTGSPSQAARALGRHAFGADQLRSAKGGKSFAAAWDAALDLAREREMHRIHGNLGALADRIEIEGDGIPDLRPGAPRRELAGDSLYDDEDPERRDYLERLDSIRDRLMHARRKFLFAISGDPAKRAAWETLVGPADWNRAEEFEPQPDDFTADPRRIDSNLPPLQGAGMILTAAAGFLPQLTGEPDAMAPFNAALVAIHHARATGLLPEIDTYHGDSERAGAEVTAYLVSLGWTEDGTGDLLPPGQPPLENDGPAADEDPAT
jgi:hypothetical protein